MSTAVQSIMNVVQELTLQQRQELVASLAVTAQRDRQQLVQSIRGKYWHVPTSSEAFFASQG